MKHPCNTSRTFALSVAALLVSGTTQAVDFQLNGTQASLYGYAKLDIIHDLDADLGNFVDRNKIRLDGEKGPDGHTNLHAFQSRLGISTLTPTPRGDLMVNVEGDFYGSGGGNLRLRHAYGEWNGITAGQTWSNFGGNIAMYPTIDFAPWPGMANASRQAQLRYTQGDFSVALEDPGNLGREVSVSAPDESKNGLPDLTLRYQSQSGAFAYGASAVLRQLEYYRDSTDNDETAFGWGLSLEARYQLGDVTLRGALTHGDGIGGYLEGSPSRPGYINPVTGELETIEASGATAGITVKAGPGAATLGYGIARSDIDDAVRAGALGGDSTEQFEAIHLNYIWSPIGAISYGVEIGHHIREVQDGREGDATRLQGMVMYRF
ncbi:DcaP family trimeric outer membrane transporter [Oceanimonas doudoroffii]|uniref:Porin n=1 Tax=Oceanimonas doudoroffii TaxID=84158 RepID=A0A233RHT5_9GAMM|nr:DcaP family trimeric outer membrane transporter [Oceanimonas doudoroffii]OXY82958.1 hypothetical protein B6S08_05495 [Oceanimonas doudoroffii]